MNQDFSNDQEIWKDIEGFEGKYQVSSMGRVKSLDYLHTGTERVLRVSKINSGYLVVGLYKERKTKKYLVHRLVAEAFIPNSDNLPCVNHKDCNPLNNKANNLEFCTYSYNNTYGKHKELQRKSHINNLEKNQRAKCVKQYSLKNEYIKTFLSGRRASEELNISHSGIVRCCSGQLKSSGGYIWKYKEAG